MRMVDFPPAMGLWWSLRRADDWRRERGVLFDRLGLGPVATPSRVVLELPELRLLAHDGRKPAPPLLIVAAPIKRAYIWDLHPSASVVRRCREHGLAVYLIEWIAHDNAE